MPTVALIGPELYPIPPIRGGAAELFIEKVAERLHGLASGGHRGVRSRPAAPGDPGPGGVSPRPPPGLAPVALLPLPELFSPL